MNFPPDILAFNVVCVFGAIVSKVNSSIALRQGREVTDDAASARRREQLIQKLDRKIMMPKLVNDFCIGILRGI